MEVAEARNLIVVEAVAAVKVSVVEAAAEKIIAGTARSMGIEVK